MKKKSFAQISARTLDYLAKKHSWFDAVLRKRVLALFFLIGYGGFVFLLVWQVYSSEGWLEVIKSYSALFFDLLVLFLFSVIFLLVRGYYSEENSRINTDLAPNRDLFIALDVKNVDIKLENSNFFRRHEVMASILDALPIDQSDYFLAHAGSLDMPKLTLLSIERSEESVSLNLGLCAFKEFFFTHHFADYTLSRSSSNDSGRRETLRSLFSTVYERTYTKFFKSEVNKLKLLEFTPNALGVTGLVVARCNDKFVYFFQRRGQHESAARGVIQLSYAGTLNALPKFVGEDKSISLEDLANDEFMDEFMCSKPGAFIKDANYHIHHQLIGLCANSQYLFQPELFIVTTIDVQDKKLLDELRNEFDADKNEQFLCTKSFDELNEYLSQKKEKLRPLCSAAIDTLYKTYFQRISHTELPPSK